MGKVKVSDDINNMLNGLGGKVKEQRQKERTRQTTQPKKKEEPKPIPFKKPNGDYYRLDLVKRKVVTNPATNHPITTEGIEVDYRKYLTGVAGREGITAYIHKLIDKDMKAHKYNG